MPGAASQSVQSLDKLRSTFFNWVWSSSSSLLHLNWFLINRYAELRNRATVYMQTVHHHFIQCIHSRWLYIEDRRFNLESGNTGSLYTLHVRMCCRNIIIRVPLTGFHCQCQLGLWKEHVNWTPQLRISVLFTDKSKFSLWRWWSPETR